MDNTPIIVSAGCNEKLQKTMTVKEVATAMGVSTDTIKNCIRRILPSKMQNGKTTFLNEQEIALISKELKNNCKVTEQLTYEAGSQVKNTTTDLEILENYKKANADFIAQPTEQIVTTKELAKILGVDVRTVNETVERLLESTFQKGEIKTISNGG